MRAIILFSLLHFGFQQGIYVSERNSENCHLQEFNKAVKNPSLNECQHELHLEKITSTMRMQKLFKRIEEEITKLGVINKKLASVIPFLCSVSRSLLLPHPEECQLYYNCSMIYETVPNRLEQYLMECEYPKLFSIITLKCMHFKEVNCTPRREIKNKCAYRQFIDVDDCEVHHPNCQGKSDGFYGLTKGPGFYMECAAERFIKVEKCPFDNHWETHFLFINNSCKNPFKTLVSDGGYFHGCSEKADGIHRFDRGSHVSFVDEDVYVYDFFRIGMICDVYYQCKKGQGLVFKCPKGTVFDSAGGLCSSKNQSIDLGCQLFCNPNNEERYPLPLHLQECPYPMQFSTLTGRCENFTKVQCKSRYEEDDFCQYYMNSYLYDLTRTCQVLHPNCVGQVDGVHKQPYHPSLGHLKGFEYYICFQQKFMGKGNCSRDPEWLVQTYPYNGKCTQKYDIPISYPGGFGRLPDCSKQRDGSYQFEDRICYAYYSCKNGKATPKLCPRKSKFDPYIEVCNENIAC